MPLPAKELGDHELFDAYCIASVRGDVAEEKRLASELERREKARQDRKVRRTRVVDIATSLAVAERMSEMWKSGPNRLDVKEYLRLRQQLLDPVVEDDQPEEERERDTDDKPEGEPADTTTLLPVEQPVKAQVKVINVVSREQSHDLPKDPSQG